MADSFFVSEPQQLVKKPAHVILNLVLNLICIIVMIIDIALPEWFSYCYFRWNLYLGRSWVKSLQDRVTGVSYADIHSALCGSFSPVIDGMCKDFCGNMHLLKAGGILFLVFFGITMVFSLFYIVIDIVLLNKGRIPSKILYVIHTQHGVWVAPLVYLGGIVLYLAVGNVYGLNYPAIEEHGFEHKSGLPLAYVVYGLELATAIHAYVKLCPFFQNGKDQFGYLRA